MIRIALIAFSALALVVPFAGCGDDDEGDSPTAGVERYCELTAELDAAGSEAFEELEADPEATEEDFEAAERAMLEENEALFDELIEVAPDEIADDVEVLLAGIRERAGLSDEEVSNRAQNDAEKAIGRFERENCEKPSSG